MKLLKKTTTYLIIITTIAIFCGGGCVALADDSSKTEDVLIYTGGVNDNFDFDSYNSVAAYAKAVYTGNYDATSFGDEFSDLYPQNYLYSKFTEGAREFNGLLLTIDEAKRIYGEDNKKVKAAIDGGATYYSNAYDYSFRHEKDVTASDGEKKDAWFSTKYWRGDKGAFTGSGMTFGIKDGTKITENDKNITFVFEYLDNGTEDIRLEYINTNWQGANFVSSGKTFARTNSGKWKIAVITVDNAKLCNDANTGSTGLFDGKPDIIIRGNDIYVSRISIIKNSDLKPISAKNPTSYCPKRTIVDNKTGRTYYHMTLGTHNAISTYVTSQHWNSDGTKFLVGDRAEDKLYEYDTVNETLRFLDYGHVDSSITGYVSPENDIYYHYNRCVYKIDWDTYERTLLCMLPAECKNISGMHVSTDGRYLSGYYNGYDVPDNTMLVRLDMVTGEFDHMYVKDDFPKINESSSGSGHPILNPEYPNILFFCNEGMTEKIPDRLWMLDFETGKMHNIFNQSYNSNGTTAETSGHEVWSKDGEYLYFVKYTKNQNKGQNGVVRIAFKDGKFTREREYINGDSAYWHCYPSGDNNWVAADTNTGEIYLMSTKSYKSYLLADFDMIDNVFNEQGVNVGMNHPYQPHPHVSYNGKSVSWQMVVDNDINKLGIAWMDISDYTDTQYTRNCFDVSDQGEIVGYSGTDTKYSTQTIDGTSYVKSLSGQKIYFDVFDDYLKSLNTKVKVTFTCYCPDVSTVKLGYSTGIDSDDDWHKYEDNEISFEASKGVNTFTAEIDSANINNSMKNMSDLYFKTDDKITYISKVIIDGYPDEYASSVNVVYAKTNSGRDYFKGLAILSNNVKKSYTSDLISVDDTISAAKYEITEEQLLEAKNQGFLYVSNFVDGAWNYRRVADSSGACKNAWFTTRNKRFNNTSNTVDIQGFMYFRVTDRNVISSDNTVTVSIEYLDNRTDGFSIRYYNCDGGLTKKTIPAKGTGKWQTAVIELTDASFDASNSKTALATGEEDFRIEAGGEDLYIAGVTVSSSGNRKYITSADNSVSSDGTSVVTVTNSTGTASDVNAYAIVYNPDGTVAGVYRSDDIQVSSNGNGTLTVESSNIHAGKKVKMFVFEKNLVPYTFVGGELNFDVSILNNTATLTWDEYVGNDYYSYRIFCDGYVVGTTSDTSYTHSNLPSGKHKWHIEVYDDLGMFVESSGYVITQ